VASRVSDELVIFRSRDYAAIRALVTDPAIFPHVIDDSITKPAEWKPIESEMVVHLLARDRAGLFGFGVFIPDTWACWRAHLGFLPRSYGELAIASFKEMLDWIWQNTRAERIVGEIVSDNRRAIQFATRAGFTPYGVNVKSKRRGGELRDQVCLGISKPE
jgi:hypothetical protein